MPPLDSLASKLLNNIVGNSNSLNTLNSLANNPGDGSSSSSKSSSFVDSSGAGSTSSGTAASPTGSSTSSETAYAAGATSSSGSAAASASTVAPPRTSATAPAPAPTPAPSNNDGATLTPVTGGTSSNSSPSNFSLDSTGTGGESTIISEPTDNSNSNNSIALPGNNANSNAETTPPPEVTAPENNSAVLTVTYDSNGDGYWLGTSDSDVITCGRGSDRIFAGSGDDIVKGNRGNDAIDGGDGNDTLRGGKGKDWLMGGNGDDFLCGNFGTNTLIGGSGADTFAFQPETASAAANPFLADRVVDFNPAEGDRIGLIGGLSVADLTLMAFDTDGDGTADATLVKFRSNNGDRILAVVLGTVNAAGATTLSNADFMSLPNEIL
ncbi:hypothetical protein QUA20_16230 [Microcoleus sp. Pol7_A1]|uniref:hypothetical protein n=1 Tax=Microcoleus sp. Pol7_A1 TaxID=2818893 RepID=UPI002FD56EA8